jgi:hypothetical protein
MRWCLDKKQQRTSPTVTSPPGGGVTAVNHPSSSKRGGGCINFFSSEKYALAWGSRFLIVLLKAGMSRSSGKTLALYAFPPMTDIDLMMIVNGFY